MTDKQIIGVVRVRGKVNLNPRIKTALKSLKLYKKNCCVIVPNKQSYLGAIKKVKDFTTFGEIDKTTFTKLLQKRGRLAGNKALTDDYMKKKLNIDIKTFVDDFFAFKRSLKDIPGFKLFFRLTPPKGGFERKGIKKSYAVGGALGYRGKDINKLVARMI
ncbi:50S ribosomal protein L30 [Candidatus Woesearchaeota archaeon]|nr:50S ribosomal protein L30 [Candidatus Woesearchaeota archaeon]